MKTLLLLAFIFSATQVTASISYYPESTLERFNNPNTNSETLRKEIFNLSDKIHVVIPGGHDVLSDNCPKESECFAQKENITYDEARKIMFGELFLENHGDGKYSVKEVYCNITLDQTQGVGPSRIPDSRYVNCEHTWPQSKFSKDFPASMQKTDMHHLFPADMRANSTRNNHPFAEVDGKETNSNCTDSRIGTAEGTTIKSFEPPREHKGNVARAIFYFSTRYKMPVDAIQTKYLKIWNKEDPVDQEERERNEKIMQKQGNRNPFVDYPELIDRI